MNYPVSELIDSAAKALKQEKNEKALALLNQAKSRKEPLQGLDYLRAVYFIRANQLPSAIQALKEELRYFPDNQQASQLLDHLLPQVQTSDPHVSDPEFQELLTRVRPYTMLSEARLYSLYQLTKTVCQKKVPGDIVECGVAGGGSTALMGLVLKQYGANAPRKIYAFDSFEGMPTPTGEDKHQGIQAELAGWGAGTCAASEAMIIRLCDQLDIQDIVFPVKGYFQETLPRMKKQIQNISLLHADGDWYESTKTIFENLYERVHKDGFIQVDDYGFWDGCRKAIQEFEAEQKVSFDIRAIDSTGVWFQKPKHTQKKEPSVKEYLNLGCGHRFHPAWTNVDFRSTGPEVIAHNLRQGIPFDDESFYIVYHSHLLEHFHKIEAEHFLRECYRVLKDEGIIRVVVPDLEQIVRLYLTALERASQGFEEWDAHYEWMMLELYDQVVRNYSGGEMADYLAKQSIPNEGFVLNRLGSDGKEMMESIRKYGRKSSANEQFNPQKIGEFRLSGEVHQWMYDRYSLAKLLKRAGFIDLRICSADESQIPDFNSFHLDIDPNGAVRKPSSLFMEARKTRRENVDQSGVMFQENQQIQTSKSSRLDEIVNQIISLEDLTETPADDSDKPLKIVHLCMQDFGGAGKAAYRLHKGLLSIGMDSTMVVLNKKSGDPSVKVLPEDDSARTVACSAPDTHHSPVWTKQAQRWHSLLAQYPKRPAGLEMFTDARSDLRLDRVQEIQEADIINLHWVGGVLDYPNLPAMLGNKPVVWTLHDMNPFTGGCHYAAGCQKYKTGCGACPQLGSDQDADLSQSVWKQKQDAYKSLNIQVVTPSQWLGGCARESALFSRFPVEVIPYGFPLDRFKPYPNVKIQNIPESAKIVLFGADSLGNQRKGFAYLLEALKKLSEKSRHQYYLMTFGSLPQGLKIPSNYPVLNAGQVGDENQLAAIYSAAHVFVLPSLEDNLPNTVVEALACGTPVVGFDIGGIPDMVVHQETGFLAKPRDINSLVDGIEWVLSAHDRGVDFSSKCRERAVNHYALEIQAKAYQQLYKARISAHQRVQGK